MEGYSEVAAPLTALGSPTARFAWSPEVQASFDTLKRALSSAPVLRTFDPRRKAVLTTDASGLALFATRGGGGGCTTPAMEGCAAGVDVGFRGVAAAVLGVAAAAAAAVAAVACALFTTKGGATGVTVPEECVIISIAVEAEVSSTTSIRGPCSGV
jgi:hypothetical protein